MTGEAEVDAAGFPNQGDPDGTGTASVTINPRQRRICFDLDVNGIAAPARGHVPRAAIGANGPIVVPIFEPDAVDLENCVAIARSPAVDLSQSPEQFYVNIHGAEFPAGGLRGQLSKK